MKRRDDFFHHHNHHLPLDFVPALLVLLVLLVQKVIDEDLLVLQIVHLHSLHSQMLIEN
jgi:hypothetical protein